MLHHLDTAVVSHAPDDGGGLGRHQDTVLERSVESSLEVRIYVGNLRRRSLCAEHGYLSSGQAALLVDPAHHAASGADQLGEKNEVWTPGGHSALESEILCTILILMDWLTYLFFKITSFE